MPLQPNLIERQFIERGAVPWPILDAMLPSFQIAAVTAAAELGVFAALSEGPLTTEELAARTSASPDGMEVLLNALDALGYVERSGESVRLTAAARRSVPLEEIGAFAPFLWDQLRLVTDTARAVREAPPRGIGDPEKIQSGAVGRGFQATMRWIASANVPEVVKHVDLPPSARRMLDVGGSHGLYSVALCAKYPSLHATILDWAIGIEEARETMTAHPEVADRIDFTVTDFEKEELPGGYDVAFLGNIVHGLSPEENLALFEKISRATTPSGMVVILDQLAGAKGSHFTRSVAALIGLNLFIVRGGRSYRFEDLSELLDGAGFSGVTRTSLRRAPGMSIVTAKKSAGSGLES